VQAAVAEVLRQLGLVVPLIVASALAAVLGMQRHERGRPAGMRTHIMVSLASCGFTLAGSYGFLDWHEARVPDRVAAQVVTGVGFLAAGVIFKSDVSVQGLTTAATLWAAAAIGMLVAANLYVVAAGVTAIGYATLAHLRERSSIVGSTLVAAPPRDTQDWDASEKDAPGGP